jgi:Ca2+-dependent lipid-binding protein
MSIYQLFYDLLFVVRQFVIKVYDQDGKAPYTQFDKHDYIGEVAFNLAHLMTAPGQRLSMEIMQGTRKRGQLTVRGETLSGTRDVFAATFVGKGLSNKDGWFGRSDPFLVISRLQEDGSYIPCWKNDKIDNNLNPVWPVARIPLVTLCNGDIDRPLRIEVWDHENSGKHQFMGQVNTSVRALIDSRGAGINIIEPEKQKKSKSYTNSGTLSVNNCHIELNPTMAQVCSVCARKCYRAC